MHVPKIDVYGIDRPDWTANASTTPMDHGVTAIAPPVHGELPVAGFAPGLVDGLVTVDDRTQTLRVYITSGSTHAVHIPG